MLEKQLEQLLLCHSTPGDETEVDELLVSHWREAGLSVTRHGHYAISAVFEQRPDRPTILVTAHMDSPGYCVQSVTQKGVQLIELGKPHFEGEMAAAVLKTCKGKEKVTIVKEDVDAEDIRYFLSEIVEAKAGDRLCFAAEPRFDAVNGELVSPFLDNRLGCYVLSKLAQSVNNKDAAFNLILGATACEEMGGFGAPVLAAATAPDVVICLDATYENEDQDVLLGAGPVLTLSDASVILSPQIRDVFQRFASERSLPLQTEVYNFSGTDARAFPHQGLPALVLPLLVPTRDNHTPNEVAQMQDVTALIEMTKAIIEEGNALLS